MAGKIVVLVKSLEVGEAAFDFVLQIGGDDFDHVELSERMLTAYERQKVTPGSIYTRCIWQALSLLALRKFL